MGLFSRTKKEAGEVDFSNLPRHIAIIMDGNGRWAKKRALPRNAGHAQGAETFRTIATYCKDIGIDYLTVYAFSTENWKRPNDEVSAIMGLLEKYLYEAIDRMERDKVKMKFFGDPAPLPPKLKALIERTSDISTHYDGCQVNVCLNYGGRDEILRAAKSCAEKLAKGDETAFSEEAFSKNLWSAGIPDPDLLIRPGGEKRMSNFLLWQAAYTELYYTDTLWPDFSKNDMNKAIAWYQQRDRRFGGV
ncbi:MAG: di-trans,poly-cis-decaprenylcistransferase [Firmicutes bacterium HGW-Firmicutes-16]|nr:MAG: di-trans,poly-cis-decaprenylcistransferase [Firmicutes bacterium HGW-Firmicutes-16]